MSNAMETLAPQLPIMRNALAKARNLVEKDIYIQVLRKIFFHNTVVAALYTSWGASSKCLADIVIIFPQILLANRVGRKVTIINDLFLLKFSRFSNSFANRAVSGKLFEVWN